jgi:hypothetical protein
VFLTVWLTASAAFPPCCWSMVYAHAHQQTPDIASTEAPSAEHHHPHHASGDSAAVDGTESVLSSLPADDCDTGSIDAATTMGVVKRGVVHPATRSAGDLVAPRISARNVARSDTAPPGTTTLTAAFLRPLRI